MQQIKNNPYRIVGLLSGATAREKERQVKRLKQFIEAEQDVQDDFSFPILGKLNRTLDSVTDAETKLNLDSDKMNAALYWFWNGYPISDEAAFDALKVGNIDIAYQIWDKMIIETKEDGKRFWKPVTEKNYSAFHNCFVLNMIKQNGNLHTAIVANLYFLESNLVYKFISSVADATFKANNKELQLMFLNQLLQETSIQQTKLLEILNKNEFSAKEEFLKGFTQKLIEPIEQKIEAVKTKRKASKANAAKAGQELYEKVENDLSQLKVTLGTNSLKYTSIADKVANEILQCSIDYFNDSQAKESNTNYFEPAIKLAKLAEVIAVGNLTKDRVKDSINTLEEMKDREISQAIEALQSIKDAYEKNKVEINKNVMSMSLGYNQTINWSKVEHMIENSLDWDKVTGLIQKVIPPQNVEKIKNVKNQTTLNQYKSLVTFVMSKLSYFQKNKVRYISYWETPGSVAMPTSGDIEKIPNWVKWVVGIIILIIIGNAC